MAPKHPLESNFSQPSKNTLVINMMDGLGNNTSKFGVHVICLRRIPQGFYEKEIREYFSQFGKVVRLRLSRSKKTGRSKGYAFLEFECDEVAKIVADTMNNYLIGERLLKCNVIPPEKVHPTLFKGCNTIFKKPSLPAVSRYNKVRTAEQNSKMTKKLLQKEHQKRKRLAGKGIDYDFPGFQRVMVRGTSSELGNVKSGVPQGSVLGLLLFLIYLNDSDRNISNKLVTFADDTKIGGLAVNLESVISSQKDLDSIQAWTDEI
uniref:Nucleolar protein interacting with the FHA domain of MKI67 n=1 Tax=Erpetoichthys calabaricus TaxID=27687 RepID=A0A8C4T3D5_ERPCA